jgi:hypothetical protein
MTGSKACASLAGMSDDNRPRDSRHQLPILLGIVGAVAGFAGLIALAAFLGLGNPADPITSGLTALFVVGPIGAIIGAFAGAKLGTLIRPAKPPGADGVAATPPAAVSTGTATGNAFKSLGIVVGTVAVVLGVYVFYDYHFNSTPWLRPNGTELQFEARLPAGTAMPSANVKADLQTAANTMPAVMKPNLFRDDGGRPVIVGEVDLAFRSSWRQIEVKIPGRKDTTYALKLATSPSHSSSLGSWERHPDGSDIRYRVKHPGKD